MKISTKGRYALRAMIELARSPKQKKMTLNEIAKKQDLSIKYLAALLVKLQEKQLIISYKGKLGGYELAKDCTQISLQDILEAVEGPLDLVNCIGHPGKCIKSLNCEARVIWLGIEQDLKGVLSKYNLNDLIK